MDHMLVRLCVGIDPSKGIKHKRHLAVRCLLYWNAAGLRCCSNAANVEKLLLVEEFLDVVVGNDLGLERISSRLVRLNHLDAFGKVLTATCFQGCNYFLCHGLLVI